MWWLEGEGEGLICKWHLKGKLAKTNTYEVTSLQILLCPFWMTITYIPLNQQCNIMDTIIEVKVGVVPHIITCITIQWHVSLSMVHINIEKGVIIIMTICGMICCSIRKVYNTLIIKWHKLTVYTSSVIFFTSQFFMSTVLLGNNFGRDLVDTHTHTIKLYLWLAIWNALLIIYQPLR